MNINAGKNGPEAIVLNASNGGLKLLSEDSNMEFNSGNVTLNSLQYTQTSEKINMTANDDSNDAIVINAAGTNSGISIDAGLGGIDLNSSGDIFIDSSNKISLGASPLSNNVIIGNTSSNTSLTFNSGSGGLIYNTSQFVVNSDGNIGIGTTDPKTSLHISNSDAIILPSGDNNDRPSSPVNGMLRYNSSSDLFEGYIGNFWLGIGGVIDLDQDTKITADQNNSDEDKLRFFTAGKQQMILNELGNLMIGQDFEQNPNLSTGYTLDVKGSLHIEGNIFQNGTLLNLTDDGLEDGQDGASLFKIKLPDNLYFNPGGQGKFGIGNDDPDSQLHVTGSSSVDFNEAVVKITDTGPGTKPTPDDIAGTLTLEHQSSGGST